MISQQWFLNPICAPEQSITIQFTHNITSVQEIQNDELNSSFDIIEELRGPDCFNYEIQQYTSKKAEYCRGIGIAKKEVQTALDTGTMDEFISILHNFIESKSIQANNLLRLDNIELVTNPHIISHHSRPKKQLQDSLNNVNQSNSQTTYKKILHESNITNKSSRKCSYCN
ncbi:7046_t:CDS:1, partial [Racocetra persica]